MFLRSAGNVLFFIRLAADYFSFRRSLLLTLFFDLLIDQFLLTPRLSSVQSTSADSFCTFFSLNS